MSIYFRSISDRKRAKDALTKQGEELKRINADLEQFAWSASHYLHGPLRMISLFTELLHVKYSDKMDAQANSYNARAVQGANRMQALIRELLAYTRATGSEKPASG
jgi:light-regulated signal transduction histidine kinase (bacteriophytochrome)